MNDDKRIEQFEQMAAADPNSELGHFSLGKVYMDAGRFGDACSSLSRVIEINSRMSKAYQLLGEAYSKVGKREEAAKVVTRGVIVSDEQGDRMPRDAMVDMLREWGEPVPAFREARQSVETAAASDTSSGGFRCCRCGRPAGRLDKPPFKGELGLKVATHVCSNCWREWIGMGTKVINELGLALSTRSGQETYDQYMIEFLQLEGTQ